MREAAESEGAAWSLETPLFKTGECPTGSARGDRTECVTIGYSLFDLRVVWMTQDVPQLYRSVRHPMTTSTAGEMDQFSLLLLELVSAADESVLHSSVVLLNQPYCSADSELEGVQITAAILSARSEVSVPDGGLMLVQRLATGVLSPSADPTDTDSEEGEAGSGDCPARGCRDPRATAPKRAWSWRTKTSDDLERGYVPVGLGLNPGRTPTMTA